VRFFEIYAYLKAVTLQSTTNTRNSVLCGWTVSCDRFFCLHSTGRKLVFSLAKSASLKILYEKNLLKRTVTSDHRSQVPFFKIPVTGDDFELGADRPLVYFTGRRN